MTTRDGDTDHLLRLLRGYGVLFLDPPRNKNADPPHQVRARTAALIVDTFTELDSALRSGAPIPEVWDGAMYHRRRISVTGPQGWDYTYPPGMTGGAACFVRGPHIKCRWIDPHADETACRRCHTIRRRQAVQSAV